MRKISFTLWLGWRYRFVAAAALWPLVISPALAQPLAPPPLPGGTAMDALARPAEMPAAPLPAAEIAEPPSHAEAFFAERLGQRLRQFGYEGFRAGGPPAAPLGTLPDDHILGRDDELVLALRGRTRQTHTLRVLRDGTLIAPDLPPVPAAGRTLRDLRSDLEARIGREMPGTEVFLSIGQVRQVGIFVGGEVARPGMHAMPALASVLDALAAAGGIRRGGSLRAIRVDGPGGSRRLDLYGVLTGDGAAPDLALREGERIVVPALGGIVAVAGDVTRPGIYELPPGTTTLPLSALLRLAGEPLRPAGNRFLKLGTDAEGRRSFTEIGPRDTLRRGDAVLVQPAADVVANRVRLAGHVLAPLTRATPPRGTTLRVVLNDARLLQPDPYLRLGVILRADPATRARSFIPFDLAAALEGRGDVRLAEGDEVLVTGAADIAWLASPPVQRALRGEAPEADACPALVQLAVAARAAPARFAHARGAGFPDIGAPSCPEIFRETPTLLPFLLDQAALLTGEVRQPGLYPILPGAGLDALLAAAGGPTDGADLSVVELAREPAAEPGAIPLSRRTLDLRGQGFSAVRLSPRDVIRIPRGFADREIGPVAVLGEVVRPGTYDIRRGERLSELLARAGGLTPQAFPYGAVFTRESVRTRQQEGFARAARDLEANLVQMAGGQAMAGSRTGSLDLGAAITAGRELASSLRQAQAAGRMVVEANPVLLAARPELDVLLEPGDLIAIPKRPNEVTVVGSVLNPGSLQFQLGWRATDYLRAAGGSQRFADPGRAFIVLPDGTATPAGLSSLGGGPPLPPGSLLVMPQDPSPFEAWGLVRDVTQVLSQITLSGAALAVISRERR